MSYVSRRMTGRCSSGAERDGGSIVHAVSSSSLISWAAALCGKSPGPKGNGWSMPVDDPVTCLRCIKKLEEEKDGEG